MYYLCSGYWMLNTKWLEHENYKNGVINKINDLVNEYQNKINNRQLWDFCKSEIKTNSLNLQ